MNVDRIAEEVLLVADEVLNRLREPVSDVSRDIVRRLRAGNKVMFCGNGGSAADAQHYAGELVNRFLLERDPYAAIALTTDSSILTSIGNDYEYADIFEMQVRALGKEGDLLVGISTSGNSENVLRAFAAAKEKGVATLAITGGSGGKMGGVADGGLSISCTTHTPRIQEGHLLILHLICEEVEERMESGK